MMFSGLPLSYRQRYGELSVALECLQEGIQKFDSENPSVDEPFDRVQQVYQDRIAPLSCEGLDSAIAPRWQSIQTEINRALHLLRSDLIFLKASRQAVSLHKRRTACLERAEQLRGYCQLLASETE